MSLPAWDPQLSVGNPTIDLQHRRLIALASQAVVLLHADAATIDQFHRVLNDVFDATREHFATEERLLARNGCPTLDAHRAEHERVLEQLADLLCRCAVRGIDRGALVQVLDGWARAHLLEVDLPSKEYMARPMPAADPR